MGTILLNPSLHSHPGWYALPARAPWAWIESVCWLSRNGRLDRFPVRAAYRFDATPKVKAGLQQYGFWVQEGDHFRVPQVVASFGGRGIRLWKFGPLEVSRPKIPDALRQAVYDRDGRACLHCGSTEALSLDHIHPFSLGGEDTFENLQTLCRPCNSRKGARV